METLSDPDSVCPSKSIANTLVIVPSTNSFQLALGEDVRSFFA